MHGVLHVHAFAVMLTVSATFAALLASAGPSDSADHWQALNLGMMESECLVTKIVIVPHRTHARHRLIR